MCTYFIGFFSLDQSDIDLRHTLANLVAVVMGSPTCSNHLWFHMFAPEQLVNTYMTGFMVSVYLYLLNWLILTGQTVHLYSQWTYL